MPSIPTGISIQYFPTPKFKKLEGIEVSEGHITATVSISGKGKITNIKSIIFYPDNLPKEPILKALKKTQFTVINGLDVRDAKIQIPFDVEQPEPITMELPEVVIESL